MTDSANENPARGIARSDVFNATKQTARNGLSLCMAESIRWIPLMDVGLGSFFSPMQEARYRCADDSIRPPLKQ